MTIQKAIGSQTTWINVTEPNAFDLEELRRSLPFIHPLNLEDILSLTERPKLDTYDDYFYISLHFPFWDNVTRLSQPYEIDFIISPTALVTAHDGLMPSMKSLFTDAMSKREVRTEMLSKSGSHAFYILLDKLVDNLFPVLRIADASLSKIETSIFAAKGETLIREIALLRRDLISMRRIIHQMVPIVAELSKKDSSITGEGLQIYFDDITDHLLRVRDIVDEDYEVIGGLSETADMLLSHRINSVMRILTVFSVIMLPLTFVSSVYGMNINLPLADHPSSFWILVGFMMFLAAFMLWFFRRQKWL